MTTTAPKKATTLKSLAASLGVSVSTVARSLKDGKGISAETVARVRQAAADQGYSPNLGAVKLRTGKSFVISAVLGRNDDPEAALPVADGILLGIHSALVKTNYALRYVPFSALDLGLDEVRSIVESGGCDGIILDHTRLQDERVRYLLEQDYPFVTFGRTELFSEHPYFDIDNEDVAYQGASKLLDHGCKRLALMNADPEHVFSKQRLRGFRRALEECGLPFRASDVFENTHTKDSAKGKTELVAKGAFDGIICVNESAYLGVREGLAAIAAPEPIFAVRTSVSNDFFDQKNVTCQHHSRERAGQQLADLLLKRIDGAPISECQRIEKTTLSEIRQ